MVFAAPGVADATRRTLIGLDSNSLVCNSIIDSAVAKTLGSYKKGRAVEEPPVITPFYSNAKKISGWLFNTLTEYSKSNCASDWISSDFQ